jgi:malate synthase
MEPDLNMSDDSTRIGPFSRDLAHTPSTHAATILSPEAREFVGELAENFNQQRLELLAQRQLRQQQFDAGQLPDFLEETRSVRETDWQVAALPAELCDRRVEITGPVERKMIINALNSGARVFMADFEDSSSPTWDNMVDGQHHLRDAVRRRIEYTNPDGRRYTLADDPAVLMVRPRGLHMTEDHP